ncbi:MAG: hypothetical protein IKQ33_02140 [Clostridia bacterium]|nr:hypothetical protein [Clostridia bacterium]
MAINNNNMYEVLQDATNQMLGSESIDNIDLQGIIDVAKTWSDMEKEQWVGKLSSRYIDTKYVDREYTDTRNDVFYEDSAKFGAITQIITMEMPDIIANRSWTQVTSGVTQIGQNTVYLPIVDEQLYAGTDSWAVSISYTGTQLNSAFESQSGLLQFDNYVKLMAQNAITYHKATMNGLNRNNYIAGKINAGNSAGKINVVNMVAEYQRDHTNTAMTVAQYLSSVNALRYAPKTFKKYKSLLMDMTTLFTTKADSKGKFIPSDRFVFQILSDYEARILSEVYSDTYHNEFVKLPLYRDVNSWQALQGVSSADFETLSTIDITTNDGAVVNQSGIVGFMVDKWAIMHTLVQNRVGYQRDDIKDISMYDYQFTSRYINNLTLNGVVFILEDYSPA